MFWPPGWSGGGLNRVWRASTDYEKSFVLFRFFAALSIHRCPLLFFYIKNWTERNRKMDKQLWNKFECSCLEIFLCGKVDWLNGCGTVHFFILCLQAEFYMHFSHWQSYKQKQIDWNLFIYVPTKLSSLVFSSNPFRSVLLQNCNILFFPRSLFRSGPCHNVEG